MLSEKAYYFVSLVVLKNVCSYVELFLPGQVLINVSILKLLTNRILLVGNDDVSWLLLLMFALL